MSKKKPKKPEAPFPKVEQTLRTRGELFLSPEAVLGIVLAAYPTIPREADFERGANGSISFTWDTTEPYTHECDHSDC